MRIDKFLWAVRLFKTRSLAASYVKEGRVTIGGEGVKPSREVKADEVVVIRRRIHSQHVRVLGFPKGRVGAKIVEDYMRDETPQEEVDKLEVAKMEDRFYPSMKGRPTKRERRTWDKWMR
ncbi:MAG: RNA-binding protein [Flavobacteriales bacterium]|nr:RNA-binding protein [Flavobacteriales bacterium]